jgi:hypothetical protein
MIHVPHSHRHATGQHFRILAHWNAHPQVDFSIQFAGDLKIRKHSSGQQYSQACAQKKRMPKRY